MVFQMQIPAGNNQRFSTDAFDNMINKTISIKGIKGVSEGVLTEVDVIDEGDMAIVTIASDCDERFIYLTSGNEKVSIEELKEK